MTSLRFRPPLWAWLGLLPMLAILLAAGWWQLDKGLLKAGLAARMQAQETAAPLQLTAASTAPAALDASAASAAGRYEPARQLLLDNQSQQRQPGYRVWTPLRLAGGGLLLVDRGWLPQDPDRRQLPEIAVDDQPRSLRGLWRPLPRAGLQLAAPDCPTRAWPRVVQYPDAAFLDCAYGEPVLPGLLLLDPAQPDGYRRDWSPVRDIPVSRHYAYAAQWFAFAATLLFLFVKLNLKSQKSHG